MTISHPLNINTPSSPPSLVTMFCILLIYALLFNIQHVSEFMKSFQNVYSMFIYFDVNYGIFKRLNNILFCLSEWISSSIYHIQTFKCFLYVGYYEHTIMAVELFMIFGIPVSFPSGTYLEEGHMIFSSLTYKKFSSHSHSCYQPYQQYTNLLFTPYSLSLNGNHHSNRYKATSPCGFDFNFCF